MVAANVSRKDDDYQTVVDSISSNYDGDDKRHVDDLSYWATPLFQKLHAL